MGCQILFGASSRQYSGLIKYVLEVPNRVFFGGFDVTYNEWRPVPEMTQHGYTFNNGAIYYNYFFQRATQHYIQNIVVPTTILTYLSFCTFLLDLRIGERLGFGMALALVVVAQQIVTTGMTPVSNQRLWLDKFVGWSFYWVLFGVIQSVLIGFIYFIREDYVAKREEKRLSTMSSSERAIMMKKEEARVAAAAQQLLPSEPSQTFNVEESVMLTENTNTQELFHESNDGTITTSFEEERRNISCFKNCFYTFSLRKMDMISLTFAIVTYTTYIAIMLATGKSDVWLQNEPKWFDENDKTFTSNLYDPNDPNSR